MKTYIVLQGKLANAVDWSTIYSPKEYRLISITLPSIHETWGVTQRHYFEQMYMVESMNDEVLHDIVSKIINEFKEDKIYIMNNEEHNLLTCVKIRKSFGLDGDTEEIITLFRDKTSMKARLIANGLGHFLPRFRTFDPDEITEDYAQQLVDTLHLPIFYKPTAESACRGAGILQSKEEVSKWIEKNMNRSAGEFEFDEYITGEAFHCDSIVKNNQVLHAQVCRYMYPCFDYAIGRPCASIVLHPDDPVLEKIRNFNEMILKGMQTVPNCTTHLELFITEDDRLIFLEIAARPPGALVCPIYEINTGIDFKLIHYKLQMGLAFDLNIKQGLYSAWARFPKREGKVVQLNSPTHLQSQYHFDHDNAVATGPRHYPWLLDSNIVLWNTNYAVLARDFDSLKNFVPVITVEE